MICDELQRMHERSAQETLLKFTEDLQDGVFLAAVMTDPDAHRPVRVLPALFERLSKFYFSIPETDEFVGFFVTRLPEWGINSSKPDVREMVVRTDCSFRGCFDLLDDALQNNGGKLDHEFIDSRLPKAKKSIDRWGNPFAEDET